jgi:hypothetical protein
MIGGFSVLDVFVCPLGDLAPLELPPDAGDMVLLCEDDHGIRWTVATTRRVTDGVKRSVLPTADGYVVPDWPSYWPQRLQLGPDAVTKLTRRLEWKRMTLMFNKPYPKSPRAEDGAVDAYWDELEAIDASQFDNRWSAALERGQERNGSR